MSQTPLVGKRVLCFVGAEYEDLELWYPKLRLEEAGAHVTVAGEQADADYRGKHGYPCLSDAAIADMEVADFHGVVCPGGWMPDKLRRIPKVLDLVRGFHARQKLVAAICHGGWIPISAGVYRGVSRDRFTRHQGRPGERGRVVGRRSRGRGQALRQQPPTDRFARLLPRDDRSVAGCSGGSLANGEPVVTFGPRSMRPGNQMLVRRLALIR